MDKKYVPNKYERELIDALRSGEFAQVAGKLRDKNGYCCLGVACELAARRGLGKWKRGAKNFIFIVNRTNSETILPAVVRDRLGWRQADGGTPNHLDRSLLVANDAGTPFAQIADMIEKGLVERRNQAL